MVKTGKLTKLVLIVLFVCAISLPAAAKTSVFVFNPNQSTVVKTGGFAGVHITYNITGQFQLSIDSDAGMASFEIVDANLIDDTGEIYGRSLEEAFNMTGLAGSVIDETTIEFEGKTADGTESDVSLKLSIEDGSAHLTGKTTPPPNSADMFFYDIDAVAIRKYAGGTGEPNDPYLIYTAEQLNDIGDEPNDWDKHIKLMANLDLDGIDLNPIGDFSYDYDGIPFTGVFDGNGKSIANFRPSGISFGIFEYVSDPNAEIRDLTLLDPNVHGGITGALVGRFFGGTIKRCSIVGGYVSGVHNDFLFSRIGGVVGQASNAVLEGCSSSASVTGRDKVGGLVGSSMGNTIIVNCTATSTVQGEDDVGGLLGYSEYTLITNSGATGDVYGQSRVGGLIGGCWRETLISGSFASGNVSAESGAAGGLVGDIGYTQIDYCYATGDVSGRGGVGGFVGRANGGPGYIGKCYSIGKVNGLFDSIGGFSGGGSIITHDCFWDVESSDTSESEDGIGLTTDEMQEPNTFVNAGWDFVGFLVNGPSDIWTIPIEGGYPIFSWQANPLPPLPSFSGGTGEPNDPFIISTAEEFNSIGLNPRLMASNFMLANDIDLNDVDLFLIGNESIPFRGVFNGDGFTIHNFSHIVEHTDLENIGLFRYVRGREAEIRNIVLDGGSIVSASEISNVGLLVGFLYGGAVINCHSQDGEIALESSPTAGYGLGGLIGYNKNGIIYGCSSSGKIQGEYEVGGLIGINEEGEINSCNSEVAVKGRKYVGGLLGRNRIGLSEVISCHATGDVYGGSYEVGGLVGVNWAFIEACSASGHVKGAESIGGLVGQNYAFIEKSCSHGDVTGNGKIGGLVGENLNVISNCYARGIVLGERFVGGIVGLNGYIPIIGGSITKSYSTGLVTGNENVNGLAYRGSEHATTSDDCFWDIDTSGQTFNDGAIGKTTAEMQTLSTFLEAGWDFVDEIENGTEDIWWILEGQDYPRLWWEIGDEVSP